MTKKELLASVRKAEKKLGIVAVDIDNFILRRNESGYVPTSFCGDEQVAMALNAGIGVNEEQMEAMMTGSMFGFDVPAAQVKE